MVSNLETPVRRPSDAARTVSDVKLSLPARPENIAVIRHLLGAFAEAARLPAGLVEDLRLAITEACTNVVRHAYRPDGSGPLEMAICPEGDRLTVVVSDRGRGLNATSIDTRGPGLGLPLIMAIADRVRLEERREGGTRVSMTFDARQREVAA